MQRRRFIGQVGILGAGSLLAPAVSLGAKKDFPVVRVPKAQRRFHSDAIENTIAGMKKRLKDPELAWLFENCFPNTLDTTVDFDAAQTDTYVITGDIDAMWLRDSSAQVWPYLPYMKEDKNLQQLIKGVIRRQTRCILLDPYANAFYKDPSKVSEWKSDLTEMKPGIHERKWEIDSLCYPIRLAHGYWKHTGDASVFDSEWKQAMQKLVKTFKEQQRKEGNGPYSFQRRTSWATDGVPMGGYGYPAKKIGLIHSMFRPSDDATVYPFLIPSNLFAVQALEDLANIYDQALKDEKPGFGLALFGREIMTAVHQYGIFQHPQFGKVYAYEVNGFGSVNLMDDANVPSLISLPYLTGLPVKDAVYQNTRKLLLSTENPFFFKGRAGEGIGGPHVGMDYIWPMGITMRAMTSTDDQEIKHCLQWLKASHAGTGFMHEAFHKDDTSKFTRKWFAWANTLFGELLLILLHERPHLLT